MILPRVLRAKHPTDGITGVCSSVVVLLVIFCLFTAPLYAVPIEVIKHLGGADTGQNPQGALLRGDDGFFYGTTRNGGRHGYGTIYRVSGDGEITTLVNFDSTTGRYPQGALTARADGSLYGTTQFGGVGGYGTVFKVTRSGLLTTVLSFSGPNGSEPTGGVLLASDGNLYGVTRGGGPQNYGTVFRVHPDDSFSTVAVFSYTNGAWPVGSLVELTAGEFLGVFRSGEPSPFGGGVFRVDYTGNLAVFKAFVNGTISRPEAGLIRANDGNFYGTSAGGGTNNIGAVYRLTSKGETSVIASFTGTNSASPKCELIQGADGDLYGTTTGLYSSSILGSVFRVNLQGTLTTLASFSLATTPSDNFPVPGLCRDTDGSMLGVTPLGGIDGKGTVFRIANAGLLQTLAYFQGDGPANPEGSLTAGPHGILYGTTPRGGTYQQGTLFTITPSGRVNVLMNGDAIYPNPRTRPLYSADGFLYGTTERGGAYGFGNLFRLPPSGGVPATLFSFNSNSPNGTFGRMPNGELIERGGMIYGTATSGGTSANSGGTVFRISKAGAITLLKAFAGPEGSHPSPGLLPSPDGSLYGVTRFGGATGNGTVFKIAPDGRHSTVASFGGQNGSDPQGELIWGDGGQLFGVTANGGRDNNGTIFAVDEAGVLTTLHSFRSSDGLHPNAGLIRASDGNFYGTTYSGGSGGWGTVFRLTPTGEFSTIASFAGPEGKYLYGSLVENSDGDLYGMTRTGGVLDAGTIFRLTIKPPEVDPLSFPGGVAGSTFTLHGRHLGPVTSVTIGDVAVPFQVVSASEVVVTLPANTVSGTLRVVAPLATVQSPQAFYSVSTLNGDDDGDGLPNSWEIKHALNPHDNGAVAPTNGTTGDGDRDGIPNLIEWALEESGFRPDKPDAELLTHPEIIGDQLIWEYRRDSRKSVTLTIEASVDLEHWHAAGGAGAPTGFKDVITADPVPPWELRRATLPVASGQRVFLRLKAAL